MLSTQTKGFPWWPCMITVDPETGKYSKIVVIRDKNNKAFHVQYFGSKAYRGYTQGNIMKYNGKEEYELRLDQIKNTPTPNKSLRKVELNNYEIKHTFKKDWNLAANQADEAMSMQRANRIETLTFEYIVDRPKSAKKKLIAIEQEQQQPTNEVKKSTTKKRKAESQQPSSTKASAKSASQSAKRLKKSTAAQKSSPTDVYDFNEFADEFEEDVTPKKPFELSSAKRAKGEYSIYAKKLRADIEKENPELNAEQVEAKLKRNWELMSEDMRSPYYTPRPSLFQSNLSFQLDSPDKSLNDADISIPDLNNSTAKSSRRQRKTSDNKKSAAEPKTYSGLKRGRKPKNETAAETNGSLDEKENAVETEEMETEDNTAVEENGKDDEEQVTSTNRSSSRKKLFNQDNKTNETANENATNNTPKRQSARTRTPRGPIETAKSSSIETLKSTPIETSKSSSIETSKSPAPSTRSSSVKKPSTKAPTPSTRTSTRTSSRQSAAAAAATTNNNDNNDNTAVIAEETPAPEIRTKSNSINKKEVTLNSNSNQLAEETNGLSEEQDSYSEESDKAEQQQKEESKEKHCAECLETDKGKL